MVVGEGEGMGGTLYRKVSAKLAVCCTKNLET